MVPAGSPRCDTRPLDVRIAALAAAQDGLVTRAGLRRLGLCDSAITARVHAGRLHRVHPGVFAVGHAALSPRARMRGAVLAGGDGALLMGPIAASAWDLRATARARIDVLTVRHRRAPKGVAFHRTRRLDARDVAEVDGLPVTSVARTVLDMAARLDDDALERLLNRAEVLRLYDGRAFADVVERLSGHHGAGRLRRQTSRPAAATRSMNEQRLLGLCDRHGIERPLVNARVAGKEVDAYWAAAAIVVEVDSFVTHGDRGTFESDRERDGQLLLAGLRTLRVTDTRLAGDSAGIADALLALGVSHGARHTGIR